MSDSSWEHHDALAQLAEAARSDRAGSAFESPVRYQFRGAYPNAEEAGLNPV